MNKYCECLWQIEVNSNLLSTIYEGLLVKINIFEVLARFARIDAVRTFWGTSERCQPSGSSFQKSKERLKLLSQL